MVNLVYMKSFWFIPYFLFHIFCRKPRIRSIIKIISVSIRPVCFRMFYFYTCTLTSTGLLQSATCFSEQANCRPRKTRSHPYYSVLTLRCIACLNSSVANMNKQANYGLRTVALITYLLPYIKFRTTDFCLLGF